ncbi:OmpA/MotB domain protein [Thalassoporum mexicanum PCC 7367]|uniref:OmpA family protein n=1 Tax=Thalassoporum mexicanum TaxID=3457544 RepID=UPI00029FE506|nr:BON domain-containing protein [Pseudanabaena sp. PCC 7367]AFY69126.1 OmpA/MotB domain protein [Pseudanabaena sp. PCC 7367]
MATPERPQDYSAHSNLDPIDETIRLHGFADLLSELAKEDKPLVDTDVVAKSQEIEKKLDLPPIPDLVKQAQEHSEASGALDIPSEPAATIADRQQANDSEQSNPTLTPVDRPTPSPTQTQTEPASVMVATDKLNALLAEVSHLRDAQTNLTTHINDLETQLKEAEGRSIDPLALDPSSGSNQTANQLFMARFGLLILLGLLILIPVGIYQYFKLVERGREKAVMLKLSAVPQLSVYRIEADVRGQNLELRGKLPQRHLRDLAEEVATAALPGYRVNNEIITIDIPADPLLVNEEAQRLAAAFSAIDGMNIEAQLQGSEVLLTGTAIRQQSINALVPAFNQLPGVEQITNQVKFTPPAIATRVYFAFESATVELRDIDGKLENVKQFMRQNPTFRLRIVGYANANEYLAEQLAQERAQAVKNILEDRGIDRRNMSAIAGAGNPPGVAADQEDWLNQAVLFELIEPDSE